MRKWHYYKDTGQIDVRLSKHGISVLQIKILKIPCLTKKKFKHFSSNFYIFRTHCTTFFNISYC